MTDKVEIVKIPTHDLKITITSDDNEVKIISYDINGNVTKVKLAEIHKESKQ